MINGAYSDNPVAGGFLLERAVLMVSGRVLTMREHGDRESGIR